MAEQPIAVDTATEDLTAYVEQERQAYIDAIFQGALDRAQIFIREGRFGRGEYELVRAELRIARLVGDAEAIDRLEQIRYFDFGHAATGVTP